jgi:hypothetical protein
MAPGRKASVSGFIANVSFEDEFFALTPTSEDMVIKDKKAGTSIKVPARYMIALEKVGKSVKSLYENANPETEDDDEDDISEVESKQSKLEALIAQ